MSNLPITLEELRRRFPRWDIAGGRDGFPPFSAILRPSPNALVYVVAHTTDELAAAVQRWEGGGEAGE